MLFTVSKTVFRPATTIDFLNSIEIIASIALRENITLAHIKCVNIEIFVMWLAFNLC